MITSKNKQYISNENKLKERCRDNNIKYNPPTGHETTNMTRSRREKMLLLLKDPGAIERRNKKRKIDSNRELTDDQRKNKNMKQRIKRKNETESQRRNRLDRHNEQRRMRRKISKARAISNHNNNDTSSQKDAATHLHTHDNIHNKLDVNYNNNEGDIMNVNDDLIAYDGTTMFDNTASNTDESSGGDNMNNANYINNNNSKHNNNNNHNNKNNNNNINDNSDRQSMRPLYIYVQSMKKRRHNLTQLSKKNRRGQTGDMHRTNKQISIMPSTSRFLYKTLGKWSLRKCCHGAAKTDDKAKTDRIMKNHKIELVDITQDRATENGGLVTVEEVTVAYDNNKYIKDDMGPQHIDHDKFETQLLDHFLEYHTIDEVQQKNKNRDGNGIVKFTRLDGGVQDRHPRNNHPLIKFHDGVKLPIIRTEKFKALPHDVLKVLFEVIFVTGQKFLDDWDGPKQYNNNCLRHELFALEFNKALGFEHANTRFEYFDILVTEVSTLSGASLYRHIDHKNDDRDGYTGSVVYSFHREHKGLHYKCSIIMTSRRVCGRVIEKIEGKK